MAGGAAYLGIPLATLQQRYCSLDLLVGDRGVLLKRELLRLRKRRQIDRLIRHDCSRERSRDHVLRSQEDFEQSRT